MSRGESPRVLAVTDVYPWPKVDGYRQRVSQLLDALTAVGTVDLFAVEPARLDRAARPDATLARVEVSVASDGSLLQKLGATVRTGLPRRVAWRDWRAARDHLDRFLGERSYDIVWYSHADTFAAFHEPRLGPAIVDLDNLEEETIRLRRLSRMSEGRALGGPTGRLRRWAASGLDRVDERRWTKLEVAITQQAALVTLCSDADRTRLGATGTAVIPNGYDWDGELAALPRRPVLVMIAMLRYLPNLHAARFLVTEVLPHLRSTIPDVELRIVGKRDERLDDLAGTPGLVLVGEVDDVAPELELARAVVVPVFSGSGTRIKILEAWAHGLPVVTTTIGCEGLGARPGMDLLIAEDADGFSDACLRLCRDDALWQVIADAGRARYEAQYRWADIRRAAATLFRSTFEQEPVAARPSIESGQQ